MTFTAVASPNIWLNGADEWYIMGKLLRIIVDIIGVFRKKVTDDLTKQYIS